MKYLYYFTSSKTLVELPLTGDKPRTIEVESFPFTYDGKTFDNCLNFINFCGQQNKKTEEEYKSKYHVNLPYLLRIYFYRIYNIYKAVALISYHDNEIKFEDNGRALNLNPDYQEDCLIDFFKKYKKESFSPEFLIEYHNLIIRNMIFRPFFDDDVVFYIQEDGVVVDSAKIFHNIHGHYLNCKNRLNSLILRNYDVTSEEIKTLLDGKEWLGSWPYGTKEQVYKIINYVNKTRCSIRNHPEFKINDDGVICTCGEFYFKQNKNQKWFLSGEMEQIFNLFRVHSSGDLKKIINDILGEKRRPGVFPECDSKEELIKIVSKLRDGQEF